MLRGTLDMARLSWRAECSRVNRWACVRETRWSRVGRWQCRRRVIGVTRRGIRLRRAGSPRSGAPWRGRSLRSPDPPVRRRNLGPCGGSDRADAGHGSSVSVGRPGGPLRVSGRGPVYRIRIDTGSGVRSEVGRIVGTEGERNAQGGAVAVDQQLEQISLLDQVFCDPNDGGRR